MNRPLPLFGFSYVLIRDFVLDLDDEEAGLKYLEYVMDELRRIYEEIQTGTHGTSPYPGIEVADYTHLFAPEQVMASFVASGQHPIERYRTPRLLASLRRLLEHRIDLRTKYGFTKEEWRSVQVPLDHDEPGPDSDDDGKTHESGERQEALPPIPFIEDESVVPPHRQHTVRQAINRAHRAGFLTITGSGLDFGPETYKTHAQLFLSYLKEFIKGKLSDFVMQFVTIRGESVPYGDIASKFPKDARTKGAIRAFFQ